MAKVIQKTIFQLVAEYSNALGRYGPRSEHARRIRDQNIKNREFIEYADSLDRIKRHLGSEDTEKQKHKPGVSERRR